MLLCDKFIGKQLITLDEGRIIGEVQDFYLDAKLETIVGLYLGSDGLLWRKPKVVQQASIQLYGIDVLFVGSDDALFEGDKLEQLEAEMALWLRRDDLKGRTVASSKTAEIGRVDDVFFNDTGEIIGFSLSKIKVEGPIAENQGIRRDVVLEPGDSEHPLMIDQMEAEQQRWFFEGA
ncbi:MAG: PRC-barrel domain-containing protein [Chloroflexota bacterium]